jgi:Transposase protein
LINHDEQYVTGGRSLLALPNSELAVLNKQIVRQEVKILKNKTQLDKLRTGKRAAVKNHAFLENSWRVKFRLARIEWRRKENIYLRTIASIKAGFSIKSKETQDKLSPILTTLQQRVLFQNKKKTHWTTTEISKAITLKAISRKAYEYVREVCSVPLPCVSTLQR